MESKKWLWVVIACLAIVAVYQIVKLTGGDSAEPVSPEAEQALEPDSRPIQTASLGELTTVLEERTPQVIEPPETGEPIQTSAEAPEDSEASEENTEPDAAETSETVEVAQMPETPPTVVDPPAEETAPAAATTTGLLESSNRGLVRAIVHSGERGSALIDETIVRTGGTVDGVRVVRIHAGGVDFEKNGHKWTQKVSQTPGPLWR